LISGRSIATPFLSVPRFSARLDNEPIKLVAHLDLATETARLGKLGHTHIEQVLFQRTTPVRTAALITLSPPAASTTRSVPSFSTYTTLGTRGSSQASISIGLTNIP
jgi:hypothetical protein